MAERIFDPGDMYDDSEEEFADISMGSGEYADEIDATGESEEADLSGVELVGDEGQW